jgi:hypothetical protein
MGARRIYHQDNGGGTAGDSNQGVSEFLASAAWPVCVILSRYADGAYRCTELYVRHYALCLLKSRKPPKRWRPQSGVRK